MMASKYVNAVYYPSWRIYKERCPSSMSLSCITHILYAFICVIEDSTLQDLRRVFPVPYLLMSTLPVGEYALKHIHLPTASGLLDYISLMAYDFTGPWTKVCGHHAQLRSQPEPGVGTLTGCGESGVEYMIRNGVPASKIVLGVPAFARSFEQAKRPGQKFKAAGVVDYCDLDDGQVKGAQVGTRLAAASYVTDNKCRDGKENQVFLSFDVPDTVRVKGRYAKETGLGGLFYCTGVGDRPGEESLVMAGFHELHAG